jgi:DNA polymerase-1
MTKETFLIIDGYALLHRAYHALPPLTNKDKPVGALYGFFSILLSVIKKFKPDRLAICLDTPKPTFRHREFIGYQSQRPPMEEELKQQSQQLRQLIKKTGIGLFLKEGYEADDVIATLVSWAKKKNWRVVVVTGDKDLMQLVDSRVSLLMPQRGVSDFVLVGPKQVKEKLGVRPDQVVDFKALVGDPSDNYQGVVGIGPKTAAALLQKYRDLKGIYRHCGEISENMRKKLIKDKEFAFLSQKLAKIIDTAKIKPTLRKVAWDRKKLQRLWQVFQQMNFKSLAKRVQADFGVEEDKEKSLQMGLFKEK